MNSENKALFEVINVTLMCMMCVQIFGVYYSALFPKEKVEEVFYECDFQMKGHVLTMPCTIRGEWD